MRIFKTVLFGILLCILTFIAIYFNVYSVFNIVSVLIIFTIIDIILFIFSKGCAVHISSDKTEYGKKSSGVIKLSVKNKCFYPISKVRLTVSVKNKFYEKKLNYYVFPLGLLSEKKIKIPFTVVRSGIYDICIDNIEYTDMLGIFRKVIKSDSKYSFIVMPEAKAENDVVITGAVDTDSIPSENVYSSNSGDISSFREYTEGDKLNSVNWKLTARMGNIYVKEYEKTSMDEAVVLLDMYIKNLDKALDNLYAILNSNTNFYVFWLPAGAEEFKNRYIADKDTIYSLLTDIYNSVPDMTENRGINEYKRLYKGHTFLYVSRKMESVQ